MSYLMIKDLVEGQIVAFEDKHSCNFKVMFVAKKTTRKITLNSLDDNSLVVEYSLATGKRLNYASGTEYSFGRIWSVEEAMSRKEQEQNAIKMKALWKELSVAVEKWNLETVNEIVNKLNTIAPDVHNKSGN